MKNMHKIDWPGIVFCICFFAMCTTCIYQENRTEQMKLENEACQCDTENGE